MEREYIPYTTHKPPAMRQLYLFLFLLLAAPYATASDVLTVVKTDGTRADLDLASLPTVAADGGTLSIASAAYRAEFPVADVAKIVYGSASAIATSRAPQRGAQYYSLGGLRLGAKPDRGPYIVRSGAAARKAMPAAATPGSRPGAATRAASGDDAFIVYSRGNVVGHYALASYDIVYTAAGGATMQNICIKGFEDFGVYEHSAPVADIDSVVLCVERPADISGVELADPQANAGAKRLYKELLDDYGQRIHTAAIANVNWNNTGIEKVHELTGRYPKISCYDFIHIMSSGPGSWIDYSNIAPVEQSAALGCTTALMWHFNVPRSEGSADVACAPDQTTFRPTRALTEGTWEHDWYVEQVDKVADVVLQLQEAGIAALWRPYHEAAGNALHKPSWGAWFWWGAEGPEAFIALWRDIFDRFTARGIHNLVWIWTAQNANGNEAEYDKDTAWYPGDGYVDIIGRDLYGQDTAANAYEFNSLSIEYPGKIVALAECGNGNGKDMAKMSQAWQQGAKWMWAMPWYDNDYLNGDTTADSMTPDGWWQDFMDMDNSVKVGF